LFSVGVSNRRLVYFIPRVVDLIGNANWPNLSWFNPCRTGYPYIGISVFVFVWVALKPAGTPVSCSDAVLAFGLFIGIYVGV